MAPLFSLPLLSKSSSNTSSSGGDSDSDAPDPAATTIIIAATHRCGPHKPLAVLAGHAGPVSSLALCGEFVLSASTGRDIVVWQLPDLRLLARFGNAGSGGGSGSVKSLIAVGPRVFSAHQDSRIRVWKLSSSAGSPENMFRLAATLPTATDRLGRCLKQSNYVQTRRHHRRLWIEHADSISCLAAGGNGLVYSGSWDKTLKVWDLSDLRCLESIDAHDDAINALAAHDGLVYSASADGRIKIWGPRPGSDRSHCLKASLEGRGQGVCWNAVVVCGGGRWVYGGGSDGRVMGWEVDEKGEGWRQRCEVRAHEKAVLCLCSTRDGGFLCSGSADSSIAVWRREGGEGRLRRVGVIFGHEGPVRCLQASDAAAGAGDGFVLYSGGVDRRVRVWWVPKDYEEEGMKKCVLLR